MTGSAQPSLQKPRRADAQRNHAAIVGAASQAFTEDGVAASLDDIGRRAGVGAGTLYRRFPRRDDLIAAVLLERQSHLEQEADVLLRGTDTHDALLTWVRLLAEFFASYRGLPDSINEAMRDGSTALGASCARLDDATRRVVDRAGHSRRSPDPVSGNDVFLIAQAIGWAVQPGGCAEDDMDRAFRLFTSSLRARG